MTPYETVADRLAAIGIGGGAQFWEAIRGNVTKLADAADWWTVVSGAVRPVIENAELCRMASTLLPPEPWGPDAWSRWTEAVKLATGLKGKALFHPLRLALTGRDAGPEMRLLLPMIGRPRVLARLAGETA